MTALSKRVPPGTQIDVLTTRPNRYRSYQAEAPQSEVSPGLSITRIVLPAHESGMRDQARAFFTYARGVIRRTTHDRYDVVIATSSRLMTAALAAWVARRMNARLYLDIRDIFVDTIKDVFSKKIAWLATPIFSALEHWTITRATGVNLVSPGFASYFEARYPRKRFTFFTNGIDDEFLHEAGQADKIESSSNVLTVLYAGNIGEGQGLHAIVPKLAVKLGSTARIRIIGDGGRKAALLQALDSHGVSNVEVVPPLPRPELIAAYRTADVLFLHLNDHDAFEKVLPSKLFEYAATGKPIWAGVAGYAAQFIRTEITNSAVFAPCDVEGALRAFSSLKIGYTPRTEFVEKFRRDALCLAMVDDILSICKALPAA